MLSKKRGFVSIQNLFFLGLQNNYLLEILILKNDLKTKNNANTKKNPPTIGAYSRKLGEIAISIASNPNNVVNLIIGFKATEEVSLNGSPTVSPITVAS